MEITVRRRLLNYSLLTYFLARCAGYSYDEWKHLRLNLPWSKKPTSRAATLLVSLIQSSRLNPTEVKRGKSADRHTVSVTFVTVGDAEKGKEELRNLAGKAAAQHGVDHEVETLLQQHRLRVYFSVRRKRRTRRDGEYAKLV